MVLVVINRSFDTKLGLFEEIPPLNISTSSPPPTPASRWGTTEGINTSTAGTTQVITSVTAKASSEGVNIESSTIKTSLGTVTTTTITSNSTDVFGCTTIQSTQPPGLEEKDVVPSGTVYSIDEETGRESPDLEQQKDKTADNVQEENK